MPTITTISQAPVGVNSGSVSVQTQNVIPASPVVGVNSVTTAQPVLPGTAGENPSVAATMAKPLVNDLVSFLAHNPDFSLFSKKISPVAPAGTVYYGAVLPSAIQQKTQNGVVMVSIGNPTAQSVINGNAYLNSIFSTVQSAGHNKLYNNPMVSVFPSVAGLPGVGQNTQQAVVCYYKNGLVYTTYHSHYPSYRNPAQNYYEIKALNELFSEPKPVGQYFTFVTPTFPHIDREHEHADMSAHVGQVIAHGTTTVPGDTICVAHYLVTED